MTRQPLYTYIPHPHIERRRKRGPVKVRDQLERDNAYKRFNAKVALAITSGVGTMTCAYIFSVIALLGLPQALTQSFPHGGSFSPLPLVQWIAQTFLQLVLLSVIIVGQNLQAAASDGRAEQTYEDAEAVLAESLKIQEHLQIQDQALEKLIAAAGGLPGAPGSGTGP